LGGPVGPSRSGRASCCGDGDRDLIFAYWGAHDDEDDDKIFWRENPGYGEFSERCDVITADVTAPISLHAADLDSDGDRDLLAVSAWGSMIVWYENVRAAGSTAQTPHASPGIRQVSAHSPADRRPTP